MNGMVLMWRERHVVSAGITLQARLRNQLRTILLWLLEANQAHDCCHSAVLDFLGRLLCCCSGLNGALIGSTGPAGRCRRGEAAALVPVVALLLLEWKWSFPGQQPVNKYADYCDYPPLSGNTVLKARR